VYDYQIPDAAGMTWVLFSQTWRAMYKVEERRLAKAGLTPEKLDVLWVSMDYPIPLTPAEISRSLFRESQTIAALLSRMEREGLVTRVPKRKGKPFTEVKITDKGEETRVAGLEVANDVVADIMSCLSPEEHRHLQEMLRKLRQKALEHLRIELLPLPSAASC